MIDMGRLASEYKEVRPWMGEHDFGTKLYYQLSLDRLVPQDHLLRRIAAAVDFSFVRSLCRPITATPVSHRSIPSSSSRCCSSATSTASCPSGDWPGR